MRQTFIKTLLTLARKDSRIILLTGDLGFTVFEEFQKTLPEQFINMGVAEQNMMGVAAGLAFTGHIVFTYSIATFASMRAFEQIRNDIAAHHLPVTIVGTGSGFGYGEAGLTHHAVEDIALMRTIPDMTIFSPADPTEVIWALHQTVKQKKSAYLRLGKNGEPILYTNTPQLKIGIPSLIRPGKTIALLVTGNIAASVVAAVEAAKKYHIEPAIYSVHTIKPINTQAMIKILGQYTRIITIEEHSLIGGLASSITEAIRATSTPTNMKHIGIPDTFFSTIGSHEYVKNKLGLSPHKILRRILAEYDSMSKS